MAFRFLAIVGRERFIIAINWRTQTALESIKAAAEVDRQDFLRAFDIRTVDERALLETLRALRTFYSMIKTTFLRLLLAAAALATAPFLAINAHGATGDIFETNEGNILRMRIPGATPGTFAGGLSNPKGLVFDGRGHLFVADAGRNAIVVFTIPDGLGSTYVSGLNSPVGLAFDTAGNLYVAEAASGNVVKFAQDGTKTTFATGLGAPAGLAFDNSGHLFVADFSGGKIYTITPAGTVSTFVTGLDFPAGLAIDGAGNLFVADSGSGSIFEFAPDMTKSTFVSGLGEPFGLAFDAVGNLIVADHKDGATLRFTPAAAKTVIFSSDFNTPQFVAVEPAPHQLLNVSTRGLVQNGDNTLIAGFVVGGTGPVGTSVLIRVLGPSLTAFGLTNALPDPVLELRDASGTLIASNNNWKDSQQNDIALTTLAPTNDNEAAILTSLHGGAFTAIVGSATGESGLAVVEVYNLQ
jgi:sugar lactone lactonase YvrE